MISARTCKALPWLPPAATAVLAVVMYDVVSDAERGSRAGAEPEVAGLMVALPFVLLCLAQVLCAVWATPVALAAQTVGAAALAVLVVVLGNDLAGELLVVAALAVPLVPPWVASRRQASRSSARSRRA